MENQLRRRFAVILEVIKVHKTNQVELILNYNYMAVHTKCVTLTNAHSSLNRVVVSKIL